jgi:hypothetical protein
MKWIKRIVKKGARRKTGENVPLAQDKIKGKYRS